MKKIIKHALVGIVLSIAAQASFAQAKWLNVPSVIQEHSQWCWSATSKSILSLYNKTPSQCQIVNWAYGLNYACGNSTFNWNSPANQPNGMYGSNGSVQNILNAWGVPNTAYSTASSWSSVQYDINNNRPFVIRYGWSSGGGHIMVGYGYYVTNNVAYIRIMNPWPGEGYTSRTYSSAVSASDHQWTHTQRPTKNAY